MNPAKPSKKQRSFGEAFAELEKITDELEGNALDLDQAIAKFERGLELSQQLKLKLRNVEQRVKKIRQKFDGAEMPTGLDEDTPES
ncbi:MAG: exodeoxyribonuclease VII small subunit [Candidatus Kerfeldbacteria bacterium]|nr:exodeoxyribonuclease VII small subunit [Candidatus Kerfeldbacteria bacterium]